VHRRAEQDPHLFNRLGIAVRELERQAQPRWQSTWTGALFGFVAAIAAALALFALDWLDLGYGIFTMLPGVSSASRSESAPVVSVTGACSHRCHRLRSSPSSVRTTWSRKVWADDGDTISIGQAAALFADMLRDEPWLLGLLMLAVGPPTPRRRRGWRSSLKYRPRAGGSGSHSASASSR
jgi:hypothetical protein